MRSSAKLDQSIKIDTLSFLPETQQGQIRSVNFTKKNKETTKRSTNHARTQNNYRTAYPKAKVSQKQKQTRATDKNRDLYFCAETQSSKLGLMILQKKN